MTIRMVRSLAVGAVLVAGIAASSAFAQSMVWNEMDANHDGVVTVEEHAANAKALFDKMDANHDGKLTKAEMTDGQKSLNAERKQKRATMKADADAKKADAAAKKAAAATQKAAKAGSASTPPPTK